MKFNIRATLYVLAAGLMFMLFQRWQAVNEPQTPPTQTTAVSGTFNSNATIPSAPQSQNQSVVTTVNANNRTTSSEHLVHVKTDVLDMLISTKGATLIQADLLDYTTNLKDDQPLALVRQSNPNRLLLASGLIDMDRGSNASPTHASIWQNEQNNYELKEDQDSIIIPFIWKNEDGISVRKTFTFYRGKYQFDVNATLINNSSTDWNGYAYNQLAFGQAAAPKSKVGMKPFTGAATSSAEDRYQKIKLSDIEKGSANSGQSIDRVKTSEGWVAMIQHYFIGAIVPKASIAQTLYTQYNPNNGDHVVGAKSNITSVAAGSQHIFETTAYVGPKVVKDLANVAPYLDKTVDYGMMFMISEFMFKVMDLVHNVLGNWGWAIIIMTILIKLIFFIPSSWAYKSMAKMRALQPEINRMRERYGDDRQTMSQEMMKLYRKEKVNPASGCLPMLLQIPFFIAFYYMLAESVELRQAPWMGWIQDLSVMDPLFILPIVNMSLMFLQQRLNPAQGDEIQQKVMMFMPLMFGFLFMWFPSGLVLYWTVSNAFGIMQQWFMIKRYGTPQQKPHNHHKTA